MSEAAPADDAALHVGPAPEQASIETATPAAAPATAPAVDEAAQASSAQPEPSAPAPAEPAASADAAATVEPAPESPSDAPVVAVAPPDAAASPDGQATAEPTPGPSEATETPASEAVPVQVDLAPIADKAAADAEIAGLKASFAKQQQELTAMRDFGINAQAHYERAVAAHDDLARQLEAANAKIAELEALQKPEDASAVLAGVQSRLDQAEAEKQQLAEQITHLQNAPHPLDSWLDTLVEHIKAKL